MNTEIEKLVTFLKNSPTASHCVENAAEILKENGFSEARMGTSGTPPGERRFVIENESTLAAFITGEKPAGEAGFRIVGTHTDAPGFRLKPEPYNYSEGLRPWVWRYMADHRGHMDGQDLGLAGNVTFMGEKGLETRLYRIDRPVLRFLPAIHLNRTANKEGFKVNAEDELLLVFGDEDSDFDGLKEMVAAAAGIEKPRLIDFSGELYDLQQPSLSGLKANYLTCGGIDNRASTPCCHRSNCKGQGI